MSCVFSVDINVLLRYQFGFDLVSQKMLGVADLVAVHLMKLSVRTYKRRR